MPTSKPLIHYEDVALPAFNELANSIPTGEQVSAYAQESLTTLSNHLRCALVIGETTSLPVRVQAPAVARLLCALADDLINLAES